MLQQCGCDVGLLIQGAQLRATRISHPLAVPLVFILVETPPLRTLSVAPCKQAAIPSAITSGETTEFQTWDISAWTDFIEIQPKFRGVAEWMSIKEVTFVSS